MDASRAPGFGFRGCIGRAQFWAQILVVVLAVGLLRLIGMGLAFLNTGTPHYTLTAFDELIGVLTMLGCLLLSLVASVLVFAIMVGSASTVVCRLHDRGRSGWWLLALCVAAHRVLTDPPLSQGAPMMASLAAAALSIWGAIELGALPGRSRDRSGAPT